MKPTLLLIILCLHPSVSFCSSACNLPIENDPISVCAFCSENHASVRWMVHENLNRLSPFDPKRTDTIGIEFQCHDPENNMVFSRDDCFNGGYLPYTTTVNTGEWRWHVLERYLSEGTECNFTATVENTFLSSSHTLTSTCTVKRPFECSGNSSNCATSPTPAVCSGEPGDSVCSCNCSSGFSENDIPYGSQDNRGVNLLCRNKNECTSEEHHCGDVDNCMDTEGGYHCLSSSTIIQSTPTQTAITAIISSTVSPSTKHESAKGADIKLLVTIPLSVTVLIILVLISLMFIIALNRYYSNDSINKMITSWQVHDKFDPEFIPAVKIDKKSAVKQSLESILASLEKIPYRDRAQGEHVFIQCHSDDQDTGRENIRDTSNTTCVVLWNDKAADSGILSGKSSNSTNSQDAAVIPVSEVTGGQTEYSSSASGSSEHEAECMQDSQERTEEVSEYPSGANIAANSLGWTSSGSDYVTEPGNQLITDLGTLHASTMSCDHEHQHVQNNQMNMETMNFRVSGLTKNGVGDDTGILSANNGSFSCSLEMDMALPLDFISSTNDHLNVYGDLIEHDTTTKDFATHAVTNEYVSSDTKVGQNLNSYGLQTTAYISEFESQDTSLQIHEERGTGVMGTNATLAHMSGIDGSTFSLSLMCDTEY